MYHHTWLFFQYFKQQFLKWETEATKGLKWQSQGSSELGLSLGLPTTVVHYPSSRGAVHIIDHVYLHTQYNLAASYLVLTNQDRFSGFFFPSQTDKRAVS